MPSILETVLGFIRPIVASGRTRFLVTISALAGVGSLSYFNPPHGTTYGAYMTGIAIAYLLVKSWTDVRASQEIDGK